MTTTQPNLLYQCTEQTVRDQNGTQRKAYRLNVSEAGGDVLYAIDDICSGSGEARALEALLTRNQVSLVHVLDVVEDWLIDH